MTERDRADLEAARNEGKRWALMTIEALARTASSEELPGLRRAYRVIRDELRRRRVIDQ